MIARIALFHLGFRPFFLGAALYSVFGMLAWLMIYTFSWQVDLNGLVPTAWHAHEMIFGYGIAIVAGFMLTAVKNWTNIQTPHGYQLLFLFLLWAFARIIPFAGSIFPLALMVIIDNLFIVLLLIHSATPIIKTRQWRQLIIITILVLLFTSNLTFYTGIFINNYQLMQQGIYAGLYLLVIMIIIMGGRVIPFFIERGAGYPVQIKSYKWLEISCILLTVGFFIAELFFSWKSIPSILTGLLFILHSLRMAGWHTVGIWRKPLLWVLYIGYGMITLGFGLKLFSINSLISPFLPLHAFSYGGIGIITLGMICRVAWGHTGRNISEPSKLLPWIFLPLIIGTVIRVLLPIFMVESYGLWIATSQILWIVSFLIFLYVYIPVLAMPRLDGNYG